MKTFSISAATAVIAALASTAAAASTTTSSRAVSHSTAPVASDPRIQGCWGSSGDLVLVNKTVQFNSRDSCGKQICNKLGKYVGASYRASECWCGDKYPPLSTLVDDTECSISCPGYPDESCGGPNAWTVYNTGIELYGVEFSADPSTTAGSGTSPTAGSGTSSSDTASTSKAASSGGGSNTAGIAAGVVVGIVAIAGIGGGIWFYMRRRRNQQIEEEHRRNAAVNAFITNGQKPGSSSGMSMTDSRMDPIMADRRMSDGSIADNQDYSRRILRVTNA